MLPIPYSFLAISPNFNHGLESYLFFPLSYFRLFLCFNCGILQCCAITLFPPCWQALQGSMMHVGRCGICKCTTSGPMDQFGCDTLKHANLCDFYSGSQACWRRRPKLLSLLYIFSTSGFPLRLGGSVAE